MMRKSLSVCIALLSVGIAIAPACAQDSPDSATSPAAFAAAVRIAGTLIGNGSSTNGACTMGFSNQCPTGDVCTCMTVNAARFSSSRIGSGRANLFLTIDTTASFGALGHACMPVYGEIDAIAKNDSPTFDIWGAACTGNFGNMVFNGAMGLANSSLFSETGYATFQSTIKQSGRVVLRFSGAAQ
jgi:hypothetical protein